MTSRCGGRSLVACAIASVLFVHASPAFAYLKLGVTVNGQSVPVKWARNPVRYFVSDRASGGISATDFQAAVARAFSTWEAVPTASVAYQFAGFTPASPGQDDGISVLGFQSRPELQRVLASTSFLIDDATGELLESDIFFNAAFAWSTSTSGETGKFDLESIALHEIGHFSGLGHSALGETELRADGTRRVIAAESVMFPIALGPGTTADRTLKADDIAGISDVYPTGDFRSATGSISGRVTKESAGVFGAHVVAFDLGAGTLVANFTLTRDGGFVIAGLSPGVHLVRIEPLDDADVDGFFAASQPVDLDFKVVFLEKLVVVPRGGDSGEIDVRVIPK